MTVFDEAKAASARGEFPRSAALLRTALETPGDFLWQTNAAKLADRLTSESVIDETLIPVRLAVLGSSTTTPFLPLLRLHCFKEGLKTQIHETALGTFQQEIMDPASRLYSFKPQVALFFVNYRDAQPGPAQAEADRWRSLWETLANRAGCAVIMNNFDSPVERPFGNLEGGRGETGLGRLRRLNALLAESAGRGVAVLDQDHLSAVVGKERWHDPRFWEHAMQAISFEGLTRYAEEAAALVKAVLGRSRKCLVVDLDNTLWGGVVGDDGFDALDLSEGYLDLQRYLKSLRERGVLLAVCSKNEDSAAREPFLRRPEMLLKLDDFSAFVANWQDKANNLGIIAETLHLTTDALAFLDDNPAECDLIRQLRPEVAVVNVTGNPAEFSRQLDRRKLFETVTVSAEDASRAAHFKLEAERHRLQAAAPDLETFLEGLEMRAQAVAFEERDVERIVQLVNKTNQFNLTTRRCTEQEIRALAKDAEARTLAVRLEDRLGHYGLVSVVILRRRGDAAEIDAWLMSCRVLGRRLEHWVFNRVLEQAASLDASFLVGRYLPTAKNALVRGLFSGFGFAPQPDGSWRLELARAKRLEVPIHDELRPIER